MPDVRYLTEEEEKVMSPALQNLSLMFTENTHRMADYEKNKYMPAVREICQTYLPYLQVYHTFCKENPQRADDAAKALAASFMEQAGAFIDGRMYGKKWKDRISMEQYRMVMAAYVVPCLKEMKAENGQTLIDEICRAWGRRYPDFPFQQTDAATLQNGFKLRLFF